MKKAFIIAALAAIFSCSQLFAQDIPAGYEAVDSLVYVRAATVDESLAGQNIFNGITVHQSQAISSALQKRIDGNKSKKISGYRVRVYFDNKQNSRNLSEDVAARFNSAFPGYGTYRSYSSPYFKVTVGNFRTKSEAMQFLQTIRGEYPSAIVVKENIEYPAIDKNNSYVVDTVKVVRPKSATI